jgi:hypothetical protein
METFYTTGLVSADLTLASSHVLIVHFAENEQIWIRQIEKLVFRSKQSDFWMEPNVYPVSSPCLAHSEPPQLSASFMKPDPGNGGEGRSLK